MEQNETEKKGISPRRAVVIFMAMCAGLMAIGLVLAAFAPKPKPASTQQSAREILGDSGRNVSEATLWLENRRGLDPAREFILKGLVRKSGERCDSVDSLLMREPGSWVMKCAPGYSYEFKFDSQGTPISAVRRY